MQSSSLQLVHTVSSRAAQVIGRARLSAASVDWLVAQHRGKPWRAALGDVRGTFHLVYATPNASILESKEGCSCVEALLELFATHMPECRHWTPEQWHQRHQAALVSPQQTQCFCSFCGQRQRVARAPYVVVSQEPQPFTLQ